MESRIAFAKEKIGFTHIIQYYSLSRVKHCHEYVFIVVGHRHHCHQCHNRDGRWSAQTDAP